mmetsp:Transcript_75461/g.209626  ORF Transcript_75461/g.209626 Transcript_75461/m.209626 type:complete len:269 (+) Transcript_75461:904-1710(+)
MALKTRPKEPLPTWAPRRQSRASPCSCPPSIQAVWLGAWTTTADDDVPADERDPSVVVDAKELRFGGDSDISVKAARFGGNGASTRCASSQPLSGATADSKIIAGEDLYRSRCDRLCVFLEVVRSHACVDTCSPPAALSALRSRALCRFGEEGCACFGGGTNDASGATLKAFVALCCRWLSNLKSVCPSMTKDALDASHRRQAGTLVLPVACDGAAASIESLLTAFDKSSSTNGVAREAERAGKRSAASDRHLEKFRVYDPRSCIKWP